MTKYLKRSDELEAQWNRLERRRIICGNLGHFMAAERILTEQNEVLAKMDEAAKAETPTFDNSGEPECDICGRYIDVKSVGLELLCCFCRNDRKAAT